MIEQSIEGRWVETDRLSLELPALAERLIRLLVRLAVTGAQRGHLRRPTARVARDGEPILDLASSLGELPKYGGGSAVDVGDAVAPRPPLDAEAVGQLVAHLGLEQEAGSAQRGVDASAVERAPPTVGTAGGVGDEDVPVELRV